MPSSATPTPSPAPVVVGYEPGDERAVAEALDAALQRACRLVVVAAAPLPERVQRALCAAAVPVDVELPPEGADIAEALLERAERDGARLLVVGLPRSGGRPAADDLLGGRARLVVLDAPCPVLSVPEPSPEPCTGPSPDGGCPSPALALTMGG
ncbi:universal stress protein [Kineococcus sp. T13]|uniref:universal stress protein n=1 Tax=Kineococcus vitellinus TaxID=2696565 RepID=UPI0014135062|nr:universal stress protein [Kineococcus vitellinus]NAZ75914.1 universal stress protein [Kineococcus vitellinus]